ncbi:MAG: phosphatidate cytidylyltransferase [Oscillospiraceae bacterium]|nr:phosphatidate cytidylyltransferase [Oscillospiraceae bacterium]
MVKRFISGVIVAFVLFFVLFLSYSFDFPLRISLAFVTVLAVWEIISLKSLTKFKTVLWASLIFSPLRCVLGSGMPWQALLYVYTILMFLTVMDTFMKNRKSKPKRKLPRIVDLCFVYVLTVIIGFALSKVVEIKEMARNPLAGVFGVLLVFALAWACDVGAYISGTGFGRNKLCPDVSPGKTVEGAVGGFLASIFFTFMCAFAFKLIFNLNINFLNLALLSILGTPIAILGDLCFSIIKRTSHVKNFSNLIPGHGGVLDRFDSVIFTAPYVYIFLNFMPVT